MSGADEIAKKATSAPQGEQKPSPPKEDKAPTPPPASQEPPKPSPSETQKEELPSGQRIFASPIAKKIALEKGVPLAKIKGSGPNGRILREDVEKYKE